MELIIKLVDKCIESNSLDVFIDLLDLRGITNYLILSIQTSIVRKDHL